MTESTGRPDFTLMFVTMLLVSFGLVMVFSASSTLGVSRHQDALFYLHRQGMFAILGLLLMLFMMRFPFERWKKAAPLLLVLSLALLYWVLAGGVVVNGAKRWIALGAFYIQPSEWTKLSLILYLAAIISSKGERIRQFKAGLLPILIVTCLVCALVLLQPDFGTMSILCMIALVCIVMGGADLRHLLLLGMCALPLFAYAMLHQDYRMKRLASFLSPLDDPTGAGYQVIQSLMALGHGGLTGAGLGRSIQKLSYLPEAHTDFIFAIIGEELGFVGAFLFLAVYFLFLWRGFVAAVRCRNLFGFIAGTGIVSMIFIQFVFNVGAVVGILPVTGVPLPFISYGGSALITHMAGAGILLSLSRKNNRNSSQQSAKQIRREPSLTV